MANNDYKEITKELDLQEKESVELMEGFYEETIDDLRNVDELWKPYEDFTIRMALGRSMVKLEEEPATIWRVVLSSSRALSTLTSRTHEYVRSGPFEKNTP